MTVKQIAESVGKSEDSVQRWIKKILDQPQNAVDTNGILRLVNSIKEKAGSKDSVHPADYTFEETILIIEAGLGKNAAGVYRASASKTGNEDYTGLMEAVERLI